MLAEANVVPSALASMALREGLLVVKGFSREELLADRFGGGWIFFQSIVNLQTPGITFCFVFLPF